MKKIGKRSLWRSFQHCLALWVSIMILASACMALAEDYTMAGFDGQDAEHDWSSNDFFVRMEDETGIHFDCVSYNDYTKWEQAKKEWLSGNGTLPDVLFKAALTQDEILEGLDNGELIDLAPLLQEYAPHLWSLLEQNPDWLSAITLPDGRIGALPTLSEMSTQNAMWINQQWLDQLGLAAPTDLESLEAVLIAFRDKDPNGNGKKDEVPLTFLGPWELKFFGHTYGITANDYNIYQDSEGKVHYWPMEESFFNLASTLHRFYQEGLMDTSGFSTTDTLRAITDDDDAVTYGMFFAPSPLHLVTVTMAKQYELLDPLLYNGQQVYRDMEQDVITGSFAITSACKDPGAMLQWVDILYTESGAIEAMVGKEGVSYSVNEEGKWEYLGEVDLSSLSELSIYDSGNMPWLFPKAFYQRFNNEQVEKLCISTDRLRTYLKKATQSVFIYGERRNELIQLQNRLGAYVDTCFARWIQGDWPLTEDTKAEFYAQLKALGADRMVSIWEELLNEP